MRIFTIQNENVNNKEFEKFLSSNLSLPLEVINKYYTGVSITVKEHYFENFFNNLLKDKYVSKEKFLNCLTDEYKKEECTEFLFDNFHISIFIINVL